MRFPKTIAGIPIILIVLLPCPYCFYFQLKHHLIREEMREKLQRENLQTITIQVNEFRWYEENREIVVDGTMFDVKSIVRRGNSYIITGLFDEAETELHIAMGRLQQREGEGPDPELVSIVFAETFTPPSLSNAIGIAYDNDLSSHNVITDQQLYNTILSILSPPPRA